MKKFYVLAISVGLIGAASGITAADKPASTKMKTPPARMAEGTIKSVQGNTVSIVLANQATLSVSVNANTGIFRDKQAHLDISTLKPGLPVKVRYEMTEAKKTAVWIRIKSSSAAPRAKPAKK